MNGWNRLFVVILICWVMVAPFLLMAEVNRPVEKVNDLCTNSALRLYGSTELDMAKYHIEIKKCLDIYVQHLVSLPKLFDALVGKGERELGQVGWAFILVPPALLWIVGWGSGRVARWVAAGFQR